jgi:hypothetical protein
MEEALITVMWYLAMGQERLGLILIRGARRLDPDAEDIARAAGGAVASETKPYHPAEGQTFGGGPV